MAYILILMKNIEVLSHRLSPYLAHFAFGGHYFGTIFWLKRGANNMLIFGVY